MGQLCSIETGCVVRLLRSCLGSVVQNVMIDKTFSTTVVKMGCDSLCVGYFVYFFLSVLYQGYLKKPVIVLCGKT